MRNERGFTLYELMVVIVLSGTVGLAITQSILGLRKESEVSKAYTQDVRGMRKVTRALTADLRNASDPGELTWRHEGDRVYRGTREMAGNVREFAVEREGEWAAVRMVIGGRNHVQVGDGAALSFRVRMRNAGRAK